MAVTLMINLYNRMIFCVEKLTSARLRNIDHMINDTVEKLTILMYRICKITKYLSYDSLHCFTKYHRMIDTLSKNSDVV